MDSHQTSSVLDDQSTALANEDQFKMVDNALPIELTNTTGTHLHQLNEDCLLEIFSRNPLTPIDLCSVAETCKRFKQITQRMFSKGFVIECDSSNGETIYTFSCEDHSDLKCTFQDTERILKNFGAHLCELYVEEDSAVVNLVAKYCDDITLKRLTIDRLKSIEGVTQQFNSIFRRLLRLKVRECDLRMAQWNMNCDSLIELVIVRSRNSVALLRHTFPILERFGFYDEQPGVTDITGILSKFVSRHRCLKSIGIYEPIVTDADEELRNFDLCKLLRAISCSCTELVELTLHCIPPGSFDISHLQNLAKLKVLKIKFDCCFYYWCDQPQCEHIDSSRALKSLKTLEISFDYCVGSYRVPNQILDVLYRVEELKLIRCELNDFPWTRLTQLRKLYILEEYDYKSSYGSVLLDIITTSMNLEQLKYKWTFADCSYEDVVLKPLTKEEFSKVCKIVERRAHVLTLECHCDFIDEENWNEKRNVKLIQLYRFD